MNENCEYNNVLTKLTFLTKRNNLSIAELGNTINVERRAMSGRAERNSKFKQQEIEQIEQAYDVDLSSVTITFNSLDRQNDTTAGERLNKIGWRLQKIQEKNEYLDKDMAKLLHISEDEYIDIKCGDVMPKIEVINRLKQCFKVSIDWLLYGEGSE